MNKQFDKRPEDKARVLAHKGSTHGLVLIEQFFVKLVRVPAYELKLIYLKFREEAPTQLERMRKHIVDLLESIDVILSNEQLPGILHLLCLLYNSITGKQIAGLHFDSLLSVLSTRTAKPNTTVAHLLCHLFEEQYPDLLIIFDHQVLLKLKDLSSIKYIPIYIDVQLLHTRYKQLNLSLRECEDQRIRLPEHIPATLNGLQRLFTELFDAESQVKAGEKNLSSYFCLWDLSLEVCLATLGQFIDKLRLAHMQNIEQRRRNDLLARQQQRTFQTPTRSFRSTPNQYCSDTNIFRDHLSVPLTPITARQRSKINRAPRDRYSVSSRDVSHAADERQEQIVQNLLPNAIPRKRGHSPTTRSVLTKRTFNALATCQTKKQPEESVRSSKVERGVNSEVSFQDDVFLASTPNDDEQDENTKMDCTTDTSDHPSARGIVCLADNRRFSASTTVRRLFDTSSDQSIPTETTSKALMPLAYPNHSVSSEESNDSREENDKENNANPDYQSISSASNSMEVRRRSSASFSLTD